MSFRSIQTKIAALSALCVIGLAVALMTYGVISSQSSRALVLHDVGELADQKTRSALQTLASTQAGVIQGRLNEAFDAARNMAHAFEAAAGPDTGTPPELRRNQFNAILLSVLTANPSFNGTYSAWEPNALDNQDASFVNRREVGSDNTGRFLPYWTRDPSGKIAIQPLVEYDSRALHPNGVMKGGWYIGPQSTGQESILDPLPYIVQGRQVYLATMSVPIMIDGRFQGVAGADFDLTFVQNLATRVKGALYNGQAAVTIINYRGLVVASSEHPDAIGGEATRLNPDFGALIPRIARSTEEVDVDPKADVLRALSPIHLGRTETPWAVMIEVPRAVAMAEVDALNNSMAARNTSDLERQALVVLLVVGAGITAMWFVARGIAKPIAAMTNVMGRLAARDFSVEIPGGGRRDEIGGMAAAVEVFKDSGLKLQASEAEAARQRAIAAEQEAAAAAERAAVAAQQQEVVTSIGAGLARLAKGDLTSRVDKAFAPEYETMRLNFNATATSLEETVRTIATATHQINNGSEQIATASDDLSLRTEQQAANIEETSAAVNTINHTVQGMAANARQAASVVQNTREAAEGSGPIVDEAVEAMSAIQRSSSQVAAIISVIDEIAFQTNLLALNAGVEAARAGDAGKGFAVVASEVRSLAQRSAEAAKEIKGLISQSTQQVENGVLLVERAGTSLKGIIGQVAEMDRLVRGISNAAQEQATSLAEINAAVSAMDRVVQQNAAMVEESTAAAHGLKTETRDLSELVGRFQVAGRAPERTGPAISHARTRAA